MGGLSLGLGSAAGRDRPSGQLHFQGDGQDFRLTEHTPGPFFTPDGEAVDLRGPTFTFRNIRLYKGGPN